MRTETSKQLIAAIHAGGPVNYMIIGEFRNGRKFQEGPYSYRYAKAAAKSLREAGHFANVERI